MHQLKHGMMEVVHGDVFDHRENGEGVAQILAILACCRQ
jgi:hypothetical protein